jgi:hypothetical protein
VKSSILALSKAKLEVLLDMGRICVVTSFQSTECGIFQKETQMVGISGQEANLAVLMISLIRFISVIFLFRKIRGFGFLAWSPDGGFFGPQTMKMFGSTKIC